MTQGMEWADASPGPVEGRAAARSAMPLALAGLAAVVLLGWGCGRRERVVRGLAISGAVLLASSLVGRARARGGSMGRVDGVAMSVPRDRVFEFWSHYEEEPHTPGRGLQGVMAR